MPSKTNEELRAQVRELKDLLAEKQEVIDGQERELASLRAGASRGQALQQRLTSRIARAIDVLMNEEGS